MNMKLTVVYECLDRILVKSKYIGCYEAENSTTKYLDISTLKSVATLSTNWCANYCGQLNYDYFGLMNGQMCGCGSVYWWGAKIDACICNIACSGNSNEICGGNNKNSLSKNLYLDVCYGEIVDNYWDGLASQYLIGKNPECCKYALYKYIWIFIIKTQILLT